MKFLPTPLSGAFLIDLEPFSDERGFFARSWCCRDFERMGLTHRLVQCNISFNGQRGTLRGMHFQAKPYEEAKLVRCTMGAMFDVIIDIRPESATFKKWFGIELSAQNRRMIYIPEGFAHGFQTLEDNTEVFYQMSEFFQPECARGIRWNDPQIGIAWPIKEGITISPKDRDFGCLQP